MLLILVAVVLITVDRSKAQIGQMGKLIQMDYIKQVDSKKRNDTKFNFMKFILEKNKRSFTWESSIKKDFKKRFYLNEFYNDVP